MVIDAPRMLTLSLGVSHRLHHNSHIYPAICVSLYFIVKEFLNLHSSSISEETKAKGHSVESGGHNERRRTLCLKQFKSICVFNCVFLLHFYRFYYAACTLVSE